VNVPQDTCLVYLVHFQKPLAHAQHYIGKSNNIDRRVLEHRNGRGSRLLRVVSARGIDWDVVRTWEFSTSAEAGKFERQLKKKCKSARRICPVCKDEFYKREYELRKIRKAQRESLCFGEVHRAE